MIKELTKEELENMTIGQIKTKTQEYKYLLEQQEKHKQADKNITDVLKGKYRRIGK